MHKIIEWWTLWHALSSLVLGPNPWKSGRLLYAVESVLEICHYLLWHCLKNCLCRIYTGSRLYHYVCRCPGTKRSQVISRHSSDYKARHVSFLVSLGISYLYSPLWWDDVIRFQNFIMTLAENYFITWQLEYTFPVCLPFWLSQQFALWSSPWSDQGWWFNEK